MAENGLRSAIAPAVAQIKRHPLPYAGGALAIVAGAAIVGRMRGANGPAAQDAQYASTIYAPADGQTYTPPTAVNTPPPPPISGGGNSKPPATKPPAKPPASKPPKATKPPRLVTERYTCPAGSTPVPELGNTGNWVCRKNGAKADGKADFPMVRK